MAAYTKEFYLGQREGSRRSARVIIPLVLDLVPARHVIDVGCGVGTWLTVFVEHGVNDVSGVDGSYVDRALLEIPSEQFIAADLKLPFRSERVFDLAVSLEVAEHLPADCAETFVATLTRLAPVVLFSAAIPFQGGAHHVNEQWPEYWATLFSRMNYVVVDGLRDRIWQNDAVEWWYAQNLLMFADSGALGRYPALRRERERTAKSRLSVVHPRKYLTIIEWMRGVRAVADAIDHFVPEDLRFVLVDAGELRGDLVQRRRAIPFLERGGEYWGPPGDDEEAIAELERLRRGAAAFVVFAWPAFWWLKHYAGFHEYLRRRFPCVLENDRVVAFDLRDNAQGSPRREVSRARGS